MDYLESLDRSWAPVNGLSKISQELVDATTGLKDGGVEEEHIVGTWVERCVLPVVAREAPMYAYTGTKDPTWVFADEFGLDEVRLILILVFFMNICFFSFDSLLFAGVRDLRGLPVGASVAQQSSGLDAAKANGAGDGGGSRGPPGSPPRGRGRLPRFLRRRSF